MNEALAMYRAMVGVGILCGVLIVSAFVGTKPIVDRNKAEALQRAIFNVIPGAKTSATFALEADGRFVPLTGKPEGRAVVHAGYDDAGELLGLAIEAQGMGYQDVIRVLYGYSFEAQAVVGIQVLETKETPGLGDRIEKDPAFLANFEKLDASLASDGSAVAHRIVTVKHGTKTEPWQIDAITGATVSSVAIGEILGKSTEQWAPMLVPRRDDFKKAE